MHLRSGDQLPGWSQADERSYGRWLDARSGLWRMTVEATAGGEWEWLVWKHDEPTRCASGTTPGALGAMAAAEQAVIALDPSTEAPLLP